MLDQMTIKSRLIILGAIAILGAAIAGAFGVNRLYVLNEGLQENYSEIAAGMHELVAVADVGTEFKTQVQEWNNILIRGSDPGEFEKYKKAFLASESKVQEKLRAVGEAFKKEKNPLLTDVENALRAHEELGKLYGTEIAAWNANDPGIVKKADKALSGKDRATTVTLTTLVSKMKDEETKHLAQQQKVAQQTYEASRNVLFVLTLVVLVITLAVVYLTIASISGQIAVLTQTLAGIRSSLDLTTRLPVKGRDEISETSRSINALLEDFMAVVKGVKGNAVQVSGASSELSSSVAQLSQSVSQQNEATSSMAASVEEMAVSVTHISDSSASAQEISRKSLTLAEEGGLVIEKTAAGMVAMTEELQTTSTTITDLGQRSQEIGNIAGVIKEIAEQTNLLALNAAIEAARAGEQGRGFAVVADEVRKLAERTAKATTEIENVIGAVQADTQKTVDEMQVVVAQAAESADVARQAGEVMVSMRKGSGEVVDVTTDIATALKEQTAASDLIAKQVEVIATMSDENSAALQSVKHSSHQLSDLSEKMRQAVDRFRV